MPDALLEIRDLKLTAATDRGPAHILRGIDLDVRRRSILGIVGESGSGKSSLANVVMGLQGAALRTEGSVSLNDVDLLALNPAQMRNVRGREIAMVFQDPMTALNPVLRVGTQLVDVARRRHSALGKADAADLAAEALIKVGLSDPQRRLSEYPHQLSGGMRQRAMIAMALLAQPELLIADEPTTALDATIEAQIVDLLIRLRDEFSGSIVFISHHLGTVARLCNEVAVMYGGHLVEYGPVRQTLSSPLHPYTRALVGCEVDEAAPDIPLKYIPGKVPDTTDQPQGCIFRARCEYAIEACATKMPELRNFGLDRRAACIRVEELS